MRVADFDFNLPQTLIAQRPIEPRDAARMLHVSPEDLNDSYICCLPGLCKPGDLMVFNETKVVPARLTGTRGDVRVSVTLHQAAAQNEWRVLAKPGKRLRSGDTIVFASDFSAMVISKNPEGEILLRFDRGGPDLLDALHTYGAIPLPPYIRGGVADDRDKADYQTMFAQQEGAVAAPTAALHFTPALLDGLHDRGVRTTTLILHVGGGTFLPVKAEDTRDHVMHAETGNLTSETATLINETRQNGGKVIAVGTTSLRLLEAASDEQGYVRPFAGTTSIFITPGYRFKAVDRLLTNFHLPRSTLFMLVAAFSGLDRMKAAYAHAIDAGYRFYSYGDCSLLDRESPS